MIEKSEGVMALMKAKREKKHTPGLFLFIIHSLILIYRFFFILEQRKCVDKEKKTQMC